jgi:hypothetical protein
MSQIPQQVSQQEAIPQQGYQGEMPMYVRGGSIIEPPLIEGGKGSPEGGLGDPKGGKSDITNPSPENPEFATNVTEKIYTRPPVIKILSPPEPATNSGRETIFPHPNIPNVSIVYGANKGDLLYYQNVAGDRIPYGQKFDWKWQYKGVGGYSTGGDIDPLYERRIENAADAAENATEDAANGTNPQKTPVSIPYGEIGNFAGTAIDTLDKNDSRRGDVASGALKGAGTGAMLGSFAGPIGTAVGAGVGAIVGGVSGNMQANQKREEKLMDKRLGIANQFNSSLGCFL